MAEADEMAVAGRRPVWVRIAKWVAIAIGVLAALVVALLLFLNTAPGKRFIGSQLAGFTTASGINVRVHDIEGSIYSRFTLHGLEVRDPKGVFLSSPAVTIDWRPFAYAHSKIDLREVLAREIVFHRLPQLKPTPTDPNAPTIPDIDLTLGHLKVDRFVIEPAVDGRRHIVSAEGSTVIADRRAQIALDAGAVVAPGVVGGDKLHLKLDAVPDDNRLAIDLKLAAPAGGLVDSYAHLGKPLALSVGGRGDWKAWNGALSGTLGGQPLAKLGLTGRNGTFRAVGDVRPGIMLTGPAARMVEPAIAIDALTTLDKRRADTKLRLRSSAFALDAAGLLDFAQSRFGNFRVNAQLLTPGAVLPNLSGKNVHAALALDGAFARPVIDYKLTADAIAFGTTGVEKLAASGKARINTDKILVPIHATALRVTGLNAAVGGLVTHLAIDGDIAYANQQVFSDNLHLRSDRIDATALILADLKSGTYTGALKGRVNDYDVNGLGRINLVTDAKLVPAPGGGFGIRGRVRIVTKKITNASLAQQLGGNAVITADVGYDPKGGATVRNLRLTAPDFRITGGEASYRLSDGAIRAAAQGSSKTYGPFSLTAAGTVANPRVVLKAARPGVGIGLVDLDATLTGSAAGYHILATGGSQYGAFNADVLVRAGNGPLAVNINRLLIAGITVRGNIVQAAAGPFAGTLAIAGSGLNGQVRLAAAGKNQQAFVNLRAAGARLPGPGGQPITIGSGLVNAVVTVLPSGPSARGSLAVIDLRSGETLVKSARATFDYAGGRGRVALTAAGTAGVPFDIAAQAAIAPDRILANLRGQANGLAFHLARPAVIGRQGGDYVLAPATIVLPQGQVTVNGRYGSRIEAHASMSGMDLSIAQVFAPTLGVGGKANGTVDFSAPSATAIPTLRARVDVSNFTRTGALTVSQPIDVSLLATLDPASGGRLAALLRRSRDAAVLGRVQARLAPIPGGNASWTTRLMQAPLSGGIRYNGPAEALWSLSGIAGQTLSGPLAVGADFGGRLNSPNVTGVIRANQLRYENTTYGTTITDIQVDGRFTESQFVLNRFQGKAGDGTISARGRVGIDAAGGFPMNIRATLDKAQLANSDAAAARVSGTIAVTNSKAAGGLVKGDIALGLVKYQIAYQGAGAVPELTGVRRKGAPPPKPAQGPAPTNWKLDIRVHADNQIFVSGMGLDSEWKTDMRIGGTTGKPSVVGRLQVVRGTFSFSGRRLTLDDQSTITFNGPLTDPELNLIASTTVQGVTATILIGGHAQKPQISFTSTPSLPQDEVLSRLLFGSSVTSLTPAQALQLAAALNSLRNPGGGGGFNPLGKLKGAAGLANLSVLGADQQSGRGTALSAGKYISNDVYVQVITDAKGFTQTQLTIALSKALSLLSQAGGYLGPSVSIRYSKQY